MKQMDSLISPIFYLLCSCLFLVIGGCQETPNSAEILPTPSVELVRDVTTSAEEPLVEEPVEVVSADLRIWTPLEVWTPKTEADGTETQPLNTLFDQFSQMYPLIKLDIQLKTMAERGGMFSYMALDDGVANHILPDVVMVQAEWLPYMVENEWIYANAIPSDPSLYTVAQTISTVDDVQVAIPFAFNPIYHRVQPKNGEDTILSTDWSIFSKSPFMASSEQELWVSIAYQHHQQSGKSLQDWNQWQQTLELIQQSNRTVLPTSAEVWNNVSSSTAIVQATYQTELLTNTISTSIPGDSTLTKSVVTGWVWAITTDDPNRQEMALEMIDFFMESTVYNDWLEVNGWLPVSAEGFESWTNTTYATFLDNELQRAISFDLSRETKGRLTEAIQLILTNKSADTAQLATEIVNSISENE